MGKVQVVLEIKKIVASRQFARKKVEAAPVGDLLYVAEVPECETVDTEHGTAFTTHGMRFLVTGVEAILYADLDEMYHQLVENEEGEIPY